VVFGEGGLHVIIIAPVGRNVPPGGQFGTGSHCREDT
jgi:hypothetical protein